MITIRNPRKVCSPLTPYRLTVMEPSDISFRHNQQNEWSFRICNELENNKNGLNLFFTLTYDNSCIPVFEYERMGSHASFPTFLTRDITLFKKRVKGMLRHKGFPESFSYICFPEFGKNPRSRVHGERPHYHFLMCLPFDIDIYEIGKIIDSSWQKGFVGWYSKYKNRGFKDYREGIIRDNDKSSSYVSKYVCKCLGFYMDSRYKRYIYDDIDCPRNCGIFPEEFRKNVINERKRELVGRFPRVLHSNNFGIAYYHYLKSLNIDDAFREFHLGHSVPGKPYRLPVPRYYKNKFFKITVKKHDDTTISLFKPCYHDYRRKIGEFHESQVRSLLNKFLCRSSISTSSSFVLEDFVRYYLYFRFTDVNLSSDLNLEYLFPTKEPDGTARHESHLNCYKYQEYEDISILLDDFLYSERVSIEKARLDKLQRISSVRASHDGNYQFNH